MAENAIQIIIDLLASEAITSLDDFTKVLSGARNSTGLLADSVDELDTALSTFTKSGLSADDMAAQVTQTLKDFGIVSGDTETLTAKLSETLKGLGVSGTTAAEGIDKASEANKGLSTTSGAATSALDRQGAALKAAGIEAASYGDVVSSMYNKAKIGAYEAEAATLNLGKGYAQLETMAGLATPALMKAATWAGLGLAGLAYEGIKQYTQFNRLITQTITQAGEAPSKMGFLTNLAESVAKTTGQNLDDVANSIYRAASGTASWNNGLGATKKQLTDIVTQVSKLNVLGNISGGAESEQASRVITALINANIRGIGRNPALAAALTNAAVGSGDMRLGDLVPGIGRGVLQSAVANNVTAKDAFAWIADLTSTGTTASVAGNYVKTGINLLANPSAQGTDVLSMIGIKPGEIGRILSSPGGLVSAAKTLKEAINQLNPSSVAGYFFNTTGQVRAGGSGLQGAINKLQTMSANSLSPQFIKDWEAGKLTTAEKQQAFSLILDKAYGGSKQFATIASILNNPSLLQNIEGHITAEDNLSYLRRSEARAEATPSQQFKKMEQSLLIDLVNIGKDLTKPALVFGHVITDVIGGLTKFKGVIYGFAGLALGLLGFAGVSKLAELGRGISPYIGAGFNRMSLMAGEDSKFSQALEARANGGGFRFLDIYNTKKHGILSKIGGESISAGQVPFDESKLSPDGQVLNSTGLKQVALLERIAINTSVGAEEGGVGGAGGGLRAAERDAEGGGPRYAPQLKDPITGRFLSAAESSSVSARMAEEESAAQTAALYYGATGRGRGIKSFRTQMNGGADTAVENIESTYASRGEASMGALDASAASIAARGAASDASLVAAGLAPVAEGGLMETLGGIAGGPVGMIGMMAAPMLIGAITPLMGKLGSLLGDWFSGGSAKPYHAKIKNPTDVTKAAAKVATALKTLRQYEEKIKDKAGKEIWVKNAIAIRANMVGYDDASAAYDKYMGIYHGSIKDSAKNDMAAYQEIYGPASKRINRVINEANRLSQSFYKENPGYGYGNVKSAYSLKALQALASTLPASDQVTFNKMLKKYGTAPGDLATDFKNLAIIGKGQKTWARGVFGDLEDEGLKDQGKQSPFLAALNQGGYFAIKGDRSTTESEVRSLIQHGTTSQVAKGLPVYAQYYRNLAAEDRKEAAAKNLPVGVKQAYEAQSKENEEQARKLDELNRTMKEAAKHTTLANESVDKLAKENASALVSSGLPQDIANALASVLSPYLRSSRVTGTSTASTTPGGVRIP